MTAPDTSVIMGHSSQKPLQQGEPARGAVWTTTFVFAALIVLTGLMFLFVKLVVIGSARL